jgi:hypothetical protein
MRKWGVVVLSAALAGCAIQRAQVAQTAREKMVGLPKERVLACMGVPAAKAAEGKTEVWTYNSGDGSTYTSGSVSSSGGFGTFAGASSSRFCTINIVMNDGLVNAVNYTGPTGGLITAGEQCAFAVENCVGNSR